MSCELRHDEQYNALMSIEEANSHVQSNADFDAALVAAGQLLVEAGVSDTLAVRLLHRHNAIAAHEIMVEAYEVLSDGAPAMATVRTHAADARPRTASVWDCRPDGSIVPLEFTVECDDVAQHEHFLGDRQALFASFNALMRRHSLDGVLGLCLISDRLVAGEGETHVETIDDERDANVVVLERDVDFSTGEMLPTTWQFDGDVTMGCKKQYCTIFCRYKQDVQCHQKSGHEGIHVGT